MLLESRIYRELGIRLSGYASRNTDGQVKIITVAETTDSNQTFAAAEAALFDDAGHMLKQWAPLPTALNSNRLIGAFSGIPKGAYRLRFAATDRAGNRGTAATSITAELPTAGPLTMSDLVLGLSRDGAFTPRLQFSSEPVALAYMDLYGVQPGAEIAVIIEVAQGLNRAAFWEYKPVVDPTTEPDRFNITAAIPIGSLPAGDYVVRATVIQKDQPEGRSVRTLRKVGGS